MPPRQGGPRAGGCIVHEPAVLPAPVPGFHPCDCGRVAAPRCILCGRVASTDGLLRRPPSCPDAPHTLATDGLIGINSHDHSNSTLFVTLPRPLHHDLSALRNRVFRKERLNPLE